MSGPTQGLTFLPADMGIRLRGLSSRRILGTGTHMCLLLYSDGFTCDVPEFYILVIETYNQG